MPKLSLVIDAIVVLALVLAIYRGYRNGLISQIIWFISLLAGYIVGSRFAGTLATVLDSFIPSQTVAVGVSFIILVVATVLIIRRIGHKITDAIKPNVVGIVNSILGAVLNGFVFIAGLLIVLNVAVLIVPKVDTWIRDTVVLERLTALNHVIGDDRITNGLKSAISRLD